MRNYSSPRRAWNPAILESDWNISIYADIDREKYRTHIRPPQLQLVLLWPNCPSKFWSAFENCWGRAWVRKIRDSTWCTRFLEALDCFSTVRSSIINHNFRQCRISFHPTPKGNPGMPSWKMDSGVWRAHETTEHGGYECGGLYQNDNSEAVIKVVERFIELEEEGLEDLTDSMGALVLSEWARILFVTIDPPMDDTRKLTITFRRKLGELKSHWHVKKEIHVL